jgi:hypothetical protein
MRLWAIGPKLSCSIKAPHILRAVQTLDDILQRMEAHQTKKQSMMRELNLASTFMNGLPGPKRFPVKASA